ncbi:MAG: RNA-binding protein [Phycisphaeraceae bacterium]|nr:RNA-binding protein [Phycisphaeraceae bacterium]
MLRHARYKPGSIRDAREAPLSGSPHVRLSLRSFIVKIYVGNLSFTTTQDTLEGLFSNYGTVNEVAVVTDRDTGRPRGFAFVTMDDEGAAKAITELNGKEFDGRSLNVNEAKPRESRSGGGGGGGRGGYGRGGGSRY